MTIAQPKPNTSGFTAAQLVAYYTRINLPSQHRHTPETAAKTLHTNSTAALTFLSALQLHQICAIPFENLSLHYSRNPSISTSATDVYHKLVERKRGGYCMENTTLLYHILLTLGFTVYATGGRVLKAVQPISSEQEYIGEHWNHMQHVPNRTYPSIAQCGNTKFWLFPRDESQRNFGLVSLLGFGTTMMATWEAVFTSNATAALNGGFPSLVWGFLFSWIGNLATAASLAEMASMAPTSGGQYHWVAMLAPEKHRVFLSWITGWIATIGWSANTAAGIFFSGSMIQGLLVLNDSTYAYHRWHGTLIMWAALGIVILVNTIAARFLPKIEGMILILHTLGFFAILIPMVYLSDHNSASTVFTDFENSAGWNSNGLAFFVGLISNTLPFIGYDGPAHMAEEVKNAAINVPYAMIFTVIVNGTLGFAITIAFAFCATDIQSALESPTGYDFMYVFQQATQSNAGTSVMTAIMIVLMICASIGFLATASRQTFAFARDRGIPGSRWLSTVGTTTKIPFWSVVFCTFITMLICLINIFSTVAFNAIVSLTIAGLFISYLIPVSLMAFKRATGEPIKWGPWKMGSLGLPVNIVSMIYLIITIVFSFFAPETPVTLASMNWSCLVFGGFVIIGLVYWFVAGKKVYTGPIRER